MPEETEKPAYPVPYLPDEELAARVVEFLNELLKLDRPAVAALIANRVPCNEELANHPSVQVAAQHGGYHVGMLGVLNGLCGAGADRYGLIEAVFEEGGLHHFQVRPPRAPEGEG